MGGRCSTHSATPTGATTERHNVLKCDCAPHTYDTWIVSRHQIGGRLRKMLTSHIGRLGNRNLLGSNPDSVGLNPGRVKPMTLKLILVVSYPGARHYYDRARTGWFTFRIIWLSGLMTLGEATHHDSIYIYKFWFHLSISIVDHW